ncbi:oligosaccharide flippase family protein [Paenibacillus thailandensis]|uniref:oligosaccharide flippase family protein n=1 Tax=Paenibacillus thailandensis TaxID=393250 RepID=UPI003634431C
MYNGVRLFVPLFNLAGHRRAVRRRRPESIHAAAAVFLITTLLVVVWSLYRLRNELKIDWFRRVVDRTAAKLMFGYGSRVFGVELLGTLYSQFDKIIILSLLSARDLGLYMRRLRVVPRLQHGADGDIERHLPEAGGLDKDKSSRRSAGRSVSR